MMEYIHVDGVDEKGATVKCKCSALFFQNVICMLYSELINLPHGQHLCGVVLSKCAEISEKKMAEEVK